MPLPTILSGNVASALGGAYEVDNSYMFGGDANTAITNTTPTNTKIFTISFWIKFHEFPTSGGDRIIFGYYSADNTQSYMYLRTDNTLGIYEVDGGTSKIDFRTTQVFRDPSSWYSIIMAIDTSQSTNTNRFKLYVNGTQVTAWNANSYPDQHYASMLNENSLAFNVGGTAFSSDKINASICEFVFIDGQQLDQNSFGEFDEDSPKIFKPKNVSSLTFGNNGFYLQFKETGTSANSSGCGADTSGNNRHHSVTNLAATDQRVDTCTLNGCTLNPLDVNPASAGDTYSEGNVKLATNNNSNAAGSRSTFAFTKGKWYVESKYTSSTAWNGVMATDTTITGSMTTGTIAWYQGRTLYVDGSNTATWGSAVSAGDIVGIALDMDNSRVTISQGGQWWGGSSFNQSQPHTFQNLTSGYDTWSFLCRSGSATSTSEWNFGSPPFAISSSNSDANGYGNMEYTVPTDYYIPNSANLAEFG